MSRHSPTWTPYLLNSGVIYCLKLVFIWIFILSASRHMNILISEHPPGTMSDSKIYQPLLDPSESEDSSRATEYVPSSNNFNTKALAIVAILSCFMNFFWALQISQNSPTPFLNRDRSLYAGLERDVPTPYRDDTLFVNHNRSIADAAWNSWVVDPGIVALPHEWVKRKMLPQAQHWPWDKNKGIYLLNGFHNIHCLVNWSLQDTSFLGSRLMRYSI